MQQNAINEILADGFVEIQQGLNSPAGISNHSASGARIFFNQNRNEIVKVAGDPAYAVFVEWSRANPLQRVPKFYSHYERGEGGKYDYFTFTRMERLTELSTSEQTEYCAWYERIINRAREGGVFDQMTDDDPFGLLSTLVGLHAVALEAQASGREMLRGFDLSKATNLMARQVAGRRELVYTDPFN